MEVKVIKERYDKIEFILEGEDHTFCNAFVQFLKRFDDIDIATYKIEHPLIVKPKIYVKLKVEKIPIDKIAGEDSEKLKKIGINYLIELLNSDIEEVSKKTGIDKNKLRIYYEEAKKYHKNVRDVIKKHLDEFIEYINSVENAFISSLKK